MELMNFRLLQYWLRKHLGPVLSFLASILFLTFLFFGFVIPQTPGRMARPSAALVEELPFWSFIRSFSGWVPNESSTVAILIVFFSAVAFFAYGAAVYLSWKYKSRKHVKKTIYSISILFCFTSIWFLPNFNTDIFNYIIRGRLVASYDANPYYTAVDEYKNDPIYPYASHRYTLKPGAKFPSWMHVNVLFAKIAGDDPVTNLLVYRGGFFLFSMANLGLIILILRKLNFRYLMPAIVMYGWNPIVALNGQSKTDTVMIFYLLLAIWLLVTDRKRFGVVALGLSVFVKLITGPLVAVYLIRDIKLKRWKDLLISVGLLAGTVFLIYLPFSRDPGLIWEHISALGEGGGSMSAVAKYLLAFLFLALTVFVGFTQNGSNARLLQGWAFVMLFFSLFLTKLGLSWYLMTLIALVALNFDRQLTIVMVVLSFSSFLFNLWYSTFTGSFNVGELFGLHKIIIYISLPTLTLLTLALVAGYRKFKQGAFKTHPRQAETASINPPGSNKHLKKNGELSNMLCVLTYHRVDDAKSDTRLDPRLISATPSVFAQQMKHLAENYKVVSMDQVVDATACGKILPPRSVLITFDDAYCDFKKHAWPVLKHYQLPATVFVPTHFPDQNERRFWWDKLYATLMTTPKAFVKSSPIGSLSLETNEERFESIGRLRAYIKTLRHVEAMDLVERVTHELANGNIVTKSVLSWDELRALAKEGVTLGPHTRTHPVLTQLEPEEVRREVVGSRDDLQAEIGYSQPIFCYPHGSHNDDVVDVLSKERFQVAFTVIDGHNDLRSADLLRLHRTNITRRSTMPIFRLRLKKWVTLIDKLRHRDRKQISHY